MKTVAEQLDDAKEIIRQKNAQLLIVERDLRRLRDSKPDRNVTAPELVQALAKLPKKIGARLHLTSTMHAGPRVIVTYEVVTPGSVAP